jgi:hypothetical protein
MDYQTIIKLYEILMTINLKVEEHIYTKNYFFYIYLEAHCQGCQNNPLSMDPSLISIGCYHKNV